jgi:hypothetical protein
MCSLTSLPNNNNHLYILFTKANDASCCRRVSTLVCLTQAPVFFSHRCLQDAITRDGVLRASDTSELS